MNWELWVTVGVIIFILYCLVRNVARPDVILIGGFTAFLVLGLFSVKFPSVKEMIESFGNEGLITVGILFIVAAGLTETGAISLLTERALGLPKSVTEAQARMMAPVIGLSALLHVTPVVSMFMPVITDWCKKTGVSPSKLFIPLSYAAIMGGTCTLIGTSTNLVVQGMILKSMANSPHDTTIHAMGMFSITPVGVVSAAAGVLYILVFSRWLLPDRKPAAAQLEDARQYTVEMLVQPGSAVDGQTIEKAGLRNLPGAYLMEIERGGEQLVAVGPDQILRGDDRLIFVGVVESVVDLQKIRGLAPATDQVFKLAEPRRNRCLVEAVISDASPMVGRSVRAGRFRTRYNAAIIAVHRNGERIRQKIGDIVLRPGDTLLLETHRSFAQIHRNNREFLLVSSIADSQPPRHEKAWVAIAILLGMVVMMAFQGHRIFGGVEVSVLTAALLAAGAMVLTRCCSSDQARRSIDWSTLLAIAASFGIGAAMEKTGLAAAAGQTLIKAFAGLGPRGVLLGVYMVTLLFTHFVTHNASAVLAFPIARAAALHAMNGAPANFMPFAICLCMAASNGFATPLGYQTHLMVYGPGGYRFTDFTRMGLALDFIVMAIAVSLAPMVFPF